MSAKLKPWVLKLSVLAVSSLLSLFLAEGFLRISETLRLRHSHQKLFCEHDPLLGWRKIPNASGTHRTDEYTVEESFNSKGLRGPEYGYEKPEGEYRILVLGDSFAEGYAVAFEDLFSEVIERELDATHPAQEFEVINAGTAGYSTDQEVLFFSHEGKKYAPDLTVLLFYENDVWYNGQARYWRGFKPRFEHSKTEHPGDDSLSLVGVPVPPPEARLSKAEDGENVRRSAFGKLKRWLWERSYLYRLVLNRVKASPTLNAIAESAGLSDESNAGESLPQQTIPDELEVFRAEGSPRFDELWRLTETLLLKLRDDAASVGSRLLIFYVPFHASIYPDEWEEMEHEYGMTGATWNPERPGIVLEEICERHGLDCFDPTEDFRARKQRLYFVEDGHWNALGHRLAGERLADFIARDALGTEQHSESAAGQE